MKALHAALSAFLVAATPQVAAEDGWHALEVGNYHEARALFEADGSAAALTSACQTGLVIGGFFEEGDEAVMSLHRALDDCAKAFSLDPGLIEARISYAAGLGFEAKRLKNPGFARASKSMLEDLLVGRDNYAITHAGLGGWHTEAYEGGLLARLVLGAHRKDAEAHLRRAVGLAPKDLAVRFEFVKFLALGKKKGRREAVGEIDILLGLSPRGAFDRFLQARAATLRSALVAGDKKAIEAATDGITAFSAIHDWRDIPPYQLPAGAAPSSDDTTR